MKKSAIFLGEKYEKVLSCHFLCSPPRDHFSIFKGELGHPEEESTKTPFFFSSVSKGSPSQKNEIFENPEEESTTKFRFGLRLGRVFFQKMA